MLIDQADLLDGMDFLFVQEFMSITLKQKYKEGDVVFSEGDKADHFYTLIEGTVKITIGDSQKEVYRITHPGEVFGWSSLLDRNYYSASAECLAPTYLHKIGRDKLDQLLQKYAEKSCIFYKRVAGMLGHRLVECYKQL